MIAMKSQPLYILINLTGHLDADVTCSLCILIVFTDDCKLPLTDQNALEIMQCIFCTV